MVLPPGHQELTRRATPTMIMPVEVPIAAVEATSPPLLTAPPPRPSIVRSRPHRACTGRSAAHRVRCHPAAAGWHVRRVRGLGVDLGLRRSDRRAPRGARGCGRLGRVSPLRKWFFEGPDALAAADHVFTSDMAALAVGQCRYGPFCDEQRQDARRRRGLPRRGRRERVRRDRARHRRRPLPPGMRRPRPRDRASARSRSPTCSCRGRARASCSAG